MFAMVVDDMTTMGDAIAIVDCCLLAIFYAGGGSGKVVLFCKKGAANKLLLYYLLDSIHPEMRRLKYTVQVRPT